MRRLINVLAAVVLVLLLVLRRWFRAVFREIEQPGRDRRHARRLRILLGPAMTVLAAFLAVSVWALVVAGYWIAAILLAAHVAMLLDLAWRRRSPGSFNAADSDERTRDR